MTAPRAIAWEGGSVTAAWHEPAEGGTWLALAHGAGGTLDTPSIVAIAGALAERGVGALRFNFPYSEARKKAPDPQARLEACYRAVAEQLRARASVALLGGRSMGGRIASQIVAAGAPADGLVFLGYPLHPPGRPERIRDAHLGDISVPMLFVQGTRDTFARADLLEATIARLPNATLHRIEGADHALTVRARAKEDVTEEIAETVASWARAISG